MKKDVVYKIWDKQACYEIYFRPLDDYSVELITYHNGEPFVNPRTRRDNNSGNTEVWDVQDARDCWKAWTIGNYEVSEVEDYLQGHRLGSGGESMNYRKAKELERTRWKDKAYQKKYPMTETEFERLERLNNE